ncbi:antibiotic biosynthesis monooxygenase [Kineosporia sp. J2-2]|uniref:Antibiotic biosynthesis monooxygenase n=1 Tax=Kineosporia corallincola TaxID=2835133 RepID=A0ABS5TRL7_9ACTN|nr:antibiotic biosynthesis monooxygenase [Kineosporia corallincola]MBT0773436.1 antibiotic biosynthesis monooxygenase [Kineosporia corallincola]
MSRIVVDDHRYVLINIFKTDAQHQQRLIEIWQGLGPADERSPGLVSVNAHVSLDGESVISYIQWRSKEDWEGILSDPGRQGRFKEVLTFATFESLHSEVVFVQRNPALAGEHAELRENDGVHAVFEVARVAPGRQQELLDLVAKPNEALALAPGWISNSVHRSFDGTAVVAYSQWESPEAYEEHLKSAPVAGGGGDVAGLATVERFQMRIEYITEADGR